MQGQWDAPVIEIGATVTYSYQLTLDGHVVESVEKEVYTHGNDELIPGLEDQLVGLKTGDEKSIVVPAHRAYGKHNENMVKELPRSYISEGQDPQINNVVFIKGEDGSQLTGYILQLKEDTMIVDFNHPFAGKSMHIDVTINNIHYL